MDILVIALSINPRPLSALELKLSGLIMESRVDTAGDNQNTHVIISNYSHCYSFLIYTNLTAKYKISKNRIGFTERI